MSNAIDLLNSLHDSQFINPEEAKEYEAILTETVNKEKECKKNNAFSILNLRESKLYEDKFKTIIEFNIEPEKNDINDKYENSKKMVEEAEANVMIAELYAEGANAALEAATTLINELLTTKASQKQKKNDVEDDSEDDVEDDSEDDVEDDSEDDVEDDSEDDVEDDSEDDVEHDSEDDSENDVENWPRVTLLYKGKNSGSDSGSYSGTNPGSDSCSYSGTNPGSKAPKRQAAIEAKEKIMSQAEIEADIKTYPVKKHKATQEHQIDESDEYDEFNEYD